MSVAEVFHVAFLCLEDFCSIIDWLKCVAMTQKSQTNGKEDDRASNDWYFSA